jgi:superfamily II DNA/RNA helicase
MIFCQTKKDADELACSSDIKQESHVLHGDIPQDKRELVLQVINYFNFYLNNRNNFHLIRNFEMVNIEYL